jgi:hypothetical protein
LLNKFQKTKSIKNQTAMLHLLMALSGGTESGHAQGTVIESVFASKINNQTSYREKSKEDVRMQDNSRDPQITSTR